jgi:hypothetical protein
MKKLCLLLSLAGGLYATTALASYDGTVTMGAGSYQNGVGGEFAASSSGLGNLGDFQTFCIEYNEHIGFSSVPYNYIINSGAVAGGITGANATDPHTGLAMDNISVGTAWLYSQFRAGASGGLASTYFVGNRQVNAGDLQKAIWWLEGETPYGVRNGYIDTAETALGNLINGGVKLRDDQIILDAGNNNFGVVALNLYTGPASGTPSLGNRAQDQLALVPEPATIIAGALLLLPFGASTLRILRKKRAA